MLNNVEKITERKVRKIKTTKHASNDITLEIPFEKFGTEEKIKIKKVKYTQNSTEEKKGNISLKEYDKQLYALTQCTYHKIKGIQKIKQ
jgi:hypothetical protein